MAKHIRCADCRYVRQDVSASDYTPKRCKGCDNRENCEICTGCPEREACGARKNARLPQGCERRLEKVCSRQALKWAAMECGNKGSEYYKALLNVTRDGDRQTRVTWGGCEDGERRDGR